MHVHVYFYVQVCVQSYSRNVTSNSYKMVFKMRPHITICQLDLDPNNRLRTLSLQIKNSQEETSVLVQRNSKCNSLFPTQNTAAGQDLMGIVALKKKIFVSHSIVEQQKSSDQDQSSQEQKQFHSVTEATGTQVLKLSHLNHIEYLPVYSPYNTFVVLKRRLSCCRFWAKLKMQKV